MPLTGATAATLPAGQPEPPKEPVQQTNPRRRVQVWFGQHIMCSYTADPVAADRYAAAMARRFRGLRVTVDELTESGLRPLPCEQLWVLAP